MPQTLLLSVQINVLRYHSGEDITPTLGVPFVVYLVMLAVPIFAKTIMSLGRHDSFKESPLYK